MKHIVTSSDNVKFVVDSDERSIPFDRALAAGTASAELAQHSDFIQLYDMSELYGPLLPHVPTPAERRASFRVILGGRP